MVEIKVIVVLCWQVVIAISVGNYMNKSENRQLDADGVDSVYDENCGVPFTHSSRIRRIVGGYEAVPHGWPWMASIGISMVNHFCGGIVIDKQWIVTAAHCYDELIEVNELRVTVGLHNVYNKNTKEVQRLDVVKVVVHPMYEDASKGYDIMLLKVTPAIHFNKYVRPLCLPEAHEEMTTGKKCFALGWGRTKENGELSINLHQVAIPILDSKMCNKTEIYDGAVTDKMICAGYLQGGKDSCQMDSGGPLTCFSNDRFELIGIVSWGQGCGERNKPGLYTKVSKYTKWLKKQIHS